MSQKSSSDLLQMSVLLVSQGRVESKFSIDSLKHLQDIWWLVRVTLVVAFGPQNCGRWWGPTNDNFALILLLFCSMTLSSVDNQR